MKKRMTFFFVLICMVSSVLAQNHNSEPEKQWKPQNDDVYLQEVSVKITTDKPVVSVAEAGGVCFALVGEQLFRIENETLKPESGAPAGISVLKSENNEIWAIATDGLYGFKSSKWNKIDDRKYVDLCMHTGLLHAATRDEIFRLENDKFVTTKPADGYYGSDVAMMMEDGTQILSDPVVLGPIAQIESYSGTLYVLRPGQLVLFDGKTVNQDFIDWGRLPSPNTSDLLSFGNRLYIATDRGLGELRGASLKIIKGADGLPVEQTTCIRKGFDNDLWIGTERGAVRLINNEWHYFGPGMWLPDGQVNDIATGKNVVYIATNTGIGIIRYEPFTLMKKAAYFERHIEEWGHKRLGFLHLLYQKNGEWVREVSENDGGHTAPYLAAMCYKYAVTGDKAARAEAVESFKAMIWLNKITEHEGFIARSIWSATGDK
ncbi:MAG: hypothetical protein Q7U86_08440, partial [Draconibacterium sp.]|nr:hypothetical protein [Draconibacterium sp.]